MQEKVFVALITEFNIQRIIKMSPIPKLLRITEINNPATNIGITTPFSVGSISNPISVLKKV